MLNLIGNFKRRRFSCFQSAHVWEGEFSELHNCWLTAAGSRLAVLGPMENWVGPRLHLHALKIQALLEATAKDCREDGDSRILYEARSLFCEGNRMQFFKSAQWLKKHTTHVFFLTATLGTWVTDWRHASPQERRRSWHESPRVSLRTA